MVEAGFWLLVVGCWWVVGQWSLTGFRHQKPKPTTKSQQPTTNNGLTQ
jgi:hypothetical protein